jgi:hypothetical protein
LRDLAGVLLERGRVRDSWTRLSAAGRGVLADIAADLADHTSAVPAAYQEPTR